MRRVSMLLIVVLFGSTLTPPARAQWVPDGFPVCVQPNRQQYVGIAHDAVGGAFIVWEDNRASDDRHFMQRLTATGAISDAWVPDGYAVNAGPPPSWKT